MFVLFETGASEAIVTGGISRAATAQTKLFTGRSSLLDADAIKDIHNTRGIAAAIMDGHLLPRKSNK
jgi:hypothetical protein